MLKGRTFLASLRSTPLRLRPSQSRSPHFTFTPPPLLRPSRATQRSISSTRLLSKSPVLRSLPWRSQPLRHRIRNTSNKHSYSTAQASTQPPQTLSGRFKELSRKYGWAAVGVYFGLSVLDFPFCFLAVRLIGPDRIGEVEHAIVNGFWSIVGVVAPSMKPVPKEAMGVDELEAAKAPAVDIHGHKEEASIWTQLLLAYGVHKSLIFFRVPLTAAVTPKIVKTLRSWGWNIGPRVRTPRVK